MEAVRSTTLLDVARHAGVSTATVSRVINDSGRVSDDVRERVDAAINALGYTPNFGGRMLAAGRSNTIGAIVPTLASAIFSVGLQEIQQALSQAGRTLLVASTDYDPRIELAQIRALVARGAEGLLLVGTDRLPETWSFLARRRTPHVVVWSYDDDPGRICVGFDNRLAARDMARTVLAFGHRRIAMISGVSEGNDRARDRQKGVRDAVDACHGARLLQLVETAYDPVAGAAAFRRVMALPDPPSAVICGNDVLAAGALSAARQMGVDVPSGVSVVGFDDIDLASLVVPALTTVRVPQVRMGRLAVDLLLDMVAGKADGRSVLLPTEIVMRDSLAPPPRSQAPQAGGQPGQITSSLGK